MHGVIESYSRRGQAAPVKTLPRAMESELGPRPQVWKGAAAGFQEVVLGVLPLFPRVLPFQLQAQVLVLCKSVRVILI